MGPSLVLVSTVALSHFLLTPILITELYLLRSERLQLLHDGTWSIDYGLALTDGQVELSVTQSDGVTTSGVFNRTVVIDTDALPPTFDIMPVSQSLRPVITGTGEPGAAVEVRATGGGLTDQPLVGILTGLDYDKSVVIATQRLPLR